MNDELIQVLSHLNSSVNALKQSVEGLKEWKAEQHSQDLDEALRASQEPIPPVSVRRGPITDEELFRAEDMTGWGNPGLREVLTAFARSRGIL